jgi:excisionase family DNA binding protein
LAQVELESVNLGTALMEEHRVVSSDVGEATLTSPLPSAVLVPIKNQHHFTTRLLVMSHSKREHYDSPRLAPLLTISDVARVLAVDRSTVFRLLRTGDLEAVRVGRRRRVRSEDIERLIEAGRERGLE